MQNNITVIVNTRNEEKNIEDCLASAYLLTKSVIVVDMESTDKTAIIAKRTGASVYDFPPSQYVEPARLYAIEKSKTDWVMILDADERIDKKLALEISSLKDGPTHYKIPRKNIFGYSVWLKNGGWWPDHQTRLINKKHLKDWPKRIHSTPHITGELGYLNNPIVHYFHGDLESMVRKTIVFERIESDLLHKAKRESSTPIFFRKYFAELYRRLIKGAGFLDGTVGIIESIYQAYSKTITYLYLYEKSRSL
jgi:glycosyltransferase involved in cell wall biosynthesis